MSSPYWLETGNPATRRQCATSFPRRSSRYGRETGIIRSRPVSRAGHPTPGPSIGHVATARALLASDHRPFYDHEPPAMPSQHAPVPQIRASRPCALSPPCYPRPRNCFPRNTPSGLSSVTFRPYIQGCRGNPAMAINGRRNKPFGPGGSTRRLHPSPGWALGFGGAELGSTRA
jgi:hypothetical protein